MIIDEKKEYALSNFSKIKGKLVKKDSDHNTLILYADIQYFLKKPDRIELFNFKNPECQEKFLKITNETQSLSDCFLKAGNFNKQAENWFKTFRSICHQSFRKIRHNSKVKVTETSALLEKRRNLIQKLKTSNENEKEEINGKIQELESEVSELVAEKIEIRFLITLNLCQTIMEIFIPTICGA